jgi:succinate dehydrogenase/fumarate reductase flavoprotein subunit
MDSPERDDAKWSCHSLVHRDAGTGHPVVGVSEQ